MRIVKLNAENLKRIKAIEITPTGDLVVISGKNGQGKTSVLDAIWFALGGGAAMRDTDKPIRDGEESAEVSVDLGDLIVTRRWTAKGTNLTVTSPDGAKYGSPQKILDELIGRLSFDPLEFAEMDAKAQRLHLLKMVNLPFDVEDLDRQRSTIFDERTEVNREVSTQRKIISAIPSFPDDTPDAETSIAAIMHRIEEEEKAHRYFQDRNNRMAAAQERLAAAQRELAEAQQMWVQFQGVDIDEESRFLPDRAATQHLLETADEVNANVRSKLAKREATIRLGLAQDESARHSGRLTALDKYRNDALRDATMPVEGLYVDEEHVTYNDVPLKQCSSAEQLRISVGIAMAMNPTVRVIRIVDGSLLDSDNLAVIEQMAKDKDFQVWMEKVDETGQLGVVIEDGSVVS